MKMKIEVWSDIVCPFCYIGKRKFETGLAKFQHKESVEIVWKSFQLNPGLVTDPNKSVDQYLSEIKGWTLAHAREMNEHVSRMAEGAGLEYNLDKAIVANSFDAHRLIQLAKKRGRSGEVSELLFRAYFTESKNTADHQVLIEVGIAAGIPQDEVIQMLNSNDMAEEVRRDIREAQRYGIRGVPFFLVNQKYAVSGAQEPSAFTEALNKAWEDLTEKDIASQNPPGEGTFCTPENECEEE